MPFLVRNLQRSVAVNVLHLQNHVALLMNLFEIESYSLGVICTSELRMKRMNQRYRNIDKATDVLSFPNHVMIPGKISENKALKFDDCLGDIFLCPSVIKAQCIEDGTDFQNSIPIYVTHGICHILGYTHQADEDLKLMFSKEKEILSSFAKSTGIISSPLTAQCDG